MPRVTLNRRKYKVSDISKWLVGKLYEKGLHQVDIANWIGISQPSLSARLKKGLFTYEELLTIFNKLEVTDEEILRLMKL